MKIILVIAVAVFVLGFGIPYFIPDTRSCTLKGCHCPTDGTSELPCNGCGFEKSVFLTGVIDVVYNCPTREILMCQNGNSVETEYRQTGTCTYHARVGLLLYPIVIIRDVIRDYWMSYGKPVISTPSLSP